jgi:hypothetical protein
LIILKKGIALYPSRPVRIFLFVLPHIAGMTGAPSHPAIGEMGSY